MDKCTLNKTTATIEDAASKNSTCILFWSATGKDSIVLLDLLARRFSKVVCCYLYIVRDLNIVEPFFLWAKQYGNVIIEQLPHPDRIRAKKYATFGIKPMLNLKELKYRDYEDFLKVKYQTDVVVYGMKIADSFVRRGIFNQAAKNEIHKDFGKYYPIVNWSNSDCLSYITIHNLPKPLKLGSKRASSGINFREETILYIKHHYPKDYEKYIKEYPLIEAKYGKRS